MCCCSGKYSFTPPAAAQAGQWIVSEFIFCCGKSGWLL